jgi:hypothetical protein
MKADMTGTQDTQYDVSSPKIALVGFLGAVILFAIVVLLVVVFYRVRAEQDYIKNESQPQLEVSRLVTRQRGMLADYRLLDRQKGVYAIPISKAMEKIVARRQANPEGPAGVEPPADAGAKPSAEAGAATKDKPAESQPEGGQP